MEAVTAPDEEANPSSADPDDEPTTERRTPMALDEDEHRNDFEHEEPTGGFEQEQTEVHDYTKPPERPPGEFAHLSDRATRSRPTPTTSSGSRTTRPARSR